MPLRSLGLIARLTASWVLLAAILLGCTPQNSLSPAATPTPVSACPGAGCPTDTPTAQIPIPSVLPTVTPQGAVPKTAIPPNLIPATPISPTVTPCSGNACPQGTAAPGAVEGNPPTFSHVILIILENKEFSQVVSSAQVVDSIQAWEKSYTMLTQYYAVSHPSLPNYLALIGGDTFGVTSDCTSCFVNAPSLPDLIEANHRTWKAYQEDLPSPCFVGDSGQYAQKHDPFIYFDPIRNNSARCQASVLPLTQLDQDLATGHLPDFAFITPNLCNDAHDCKLKTSSAWLLDTVGKIMKSSAFDQNSLIVVTFDEGTSDASCCGLASGGGQVVTLLISPLVKPGFKDDTPYTHYSLLKTIATSWGLPLIGHAADPTTNLIQAPWATNP